jgi:hypothetical protein
MSSLRPAAPATRMADLEPIVGRYLRLTLGGRAHRVYFEEAGQGIPLVCLHTAGSDGRQFRHLTLGARVFKGLAAGHALARTCALRMRRIRRMGDWRARFLGAAWRIEWRMAAR